MEIDIEKLKAGMCKENSGCNGLTFCACDALDSLMERISQLTKERDHVLQVNIDQHEEIKRLKAALAEAGV